MAPSTGAINRCCRQQISGYRIRLVGSTTVACAALALSLPVAIVHSRRATKSAFMRSSRARGHAPSCSSPPRANRCEDDAAATRAARHGLDKRKRRSAKLEPGAAISQAVGARRSPSPRASAVARLGDGVRSTRRRVQNEPLAISPCGHEPPGPGGFGTGKGSASAVVVMSASMRERAVFIGLISVWDTIGTLPPFRSYIAAS